MSKNLKEKMLKPVLFFVILLNLGCNSSVVFESDDLKILKLTENTWQHISYLPNSRLWESGMQRIDLREQGRGGDF